MSKLTTAEAMANAVPARATCHAVHPSGIRDINHSGIGFVLFPYSIPVRAAHGIAA